MREKDGERYIVALNPSSKSVSSTFGLEAMRVFEVCTTAKGSAKFIIAPAKKRNTVKLKPMSGVVYRVE